MIKNEAEYDAYILAIGSKMSPEALAHALGFTASIAVGMSVITEAILKTEGKSPDEISKAYTELAMKFIDKTQRELYKACDKNEELGAFIQACSRFNPNITPEKIDSFLKSVSDEIVKEADKALKDESNSTL